MMSMNDYLNEMEFAAKNTIAVIWGERERLVQLRAEIDSLTKLVQENYSRAETIALSAEDPDDVGIATGMYWDTYFEDDKVRYHKEESFQKLNEQFKTHEFSIYSASGSLLQYAKQGISLVHKGLSGCLMVARSVHNF
jgi:hypothetical protein